MLAGNGWLERARRRQAGNAKHAQENMGKSRDAASYLTFWMTPLWRRVCCNAAGLRPMAFGAEVGEM